MPAYGKKLPICLINYTPCHEHVYAIGGIAPSFLTSTLDGGKHVLETCHFSPDERAPSTHWASGCMGSRVALDAKEKINNLPAPQFIAVIYLIYLISLSMWM
jgi:hypothetical protein